MQNDNMKIDGSFLEVLLELKNVIMKKLKVATLGIVKTVDTSNHMISITPFPILENEKEKNIKCLCYDNTVDKDDVVLVLFLDRSSLINLKRIVNGNKAIMQINDYNFHTEEYGIVIQTVVKGGDN